MAALPTTVQDALKIADVRLVLGAHQQRSGRGSGDAVYADVAPQAWTASCTTAAMPNAEAWALMAKLSSLRGGLGTMLLYNASLPYPPADPDGSILGAATPTVTLITDASTIRIGGLPAAYPIKAGTFLSIAYGSGRLYLGQVVDDVTASGGGSASGVKITPALPESVALADAVTLVKAPGLFRVVPGSAYPQSADLVNMTITFDAEQTYGPA